MPAIIFSQFLRIKFYALFPSLSRPFFSPCFRPDKCNEEMGEQIKDTPLFFGSFYLLKFLLHLETTEKIRRWLNNLSGEFFLFSLSIPHRFPRDRKKLRSYFSLTPDF